MANQNKEEIDELQAKVAQLKAEMGYKSAESQKLLAIHVVNGKCVSEDHACVPEEKLPMDHLDRNDYVLISDVRRTYIDWYASIEITYESNAPDKRFNMRNVETPQTFHIITHECVEGDAVRCIAREVPVGSMLDPKDYVRIEDLAQLWGGEPPTGGDVFMGPQPPAKRAEIDACPKPTGAGQSRLAARYLASGCGEIEPSKTKRAAEPQITITGPAIDCPYDGEQFYTTANGKKFQIACGWDYYGRDISFVKANSAEECATFCSMTDGCIATSWLPSNQFCYMKSSVAPGVANSAIIGEKCVNCDEDPSTSSVVPCTTVVTQIIEPSTYISSTLSSSPVFRAEYPTIVYRGSSPSAYRRRDLEARPTSQARIVEAVVTETVTMPPAAEATSVSAIDKIQDAVRDARPGDAAGWVALGGVVAIVLFLIIRAFRAHRRNQRGMGRVQV